MENFDYLVRVLSESIKLTSEDKEFIRPLFEAVRFRKGEFFLREGEVCNQLGFLCKGVFRYYIEQDAEDKTYNFASEGDFVCNYESMIKQIPSPKHIQALEECEMLVISRENLEKFYDGVAEGNRFGRIHMEHVFTETIRQLIEQYTESPEHRYLKFLRNHADLNQRIPQYYIASFVGVKPQSLSRIRKRLTTKVVY